MSPKGIISCILYSHPVICAATKRLLLTNRVEPFQPVSSISGSVFPPDARLAPLRVRLPVLAGSSVIHVLFKNDGEVSHFPPVKLTQRQASLKTEAEKRAWDYAKNVEMKLVVMNPTAVIGPYFHRHTPSTMLFEKLLKNELPVLPPQTFGYVDVRDVALGHLKAYENENAEEGKTGASRKRTH